MGIINSVLNHLWYTDTFDYAFTELWTEQPYAKEAKHGQ
jgi:hypothetical protein